MFSNLSYWSTTFFKLGPQLLPRSHPETRADLRSIFVSAWLRRGATGGAMATRKKEATKSEVGFRWLSGEWEDFLFGKTIGKMGELFISRSFNMF